MSHNRMTTEQLKAAYPMPWKYVVNGLQPNGQGRIVVADAHDKEVPMFSMLDFVCDLTSRIAAQDFVKANPQASQPTGTTAKP